MWLGLRRLRMSKITVHEWKLCSKIENTIKMQKRVHKYTLNKMIFQAIERASKCLIKNAEQKLISHYFPYRIMNN